METVKVLYPGQRFGRKYKPRYCFAGTDMVAKVTMNPDRRWSYWDKSFKRIMYLEDYLCVSTLKKCNGGRKRENIAFTMCCYLDLDGLEGGLPVQHIIWRCEQLGIPYPVTVQTSQVRFQLKWYLEGAVNADSTSQVRMWERVQSGLHEAFKDLGSDKCLIHDRTRLLRNEFALKSVNNKHGKPFGVNTIYWGDGLTSLKHIYYLLAKAGYIRKPRPKRDKSGWKSMQSRVMRIFAYFKKYPSIECTQQFLANVLGIPLRSLEKVLAWMDSRGILKSQLVGKGHSRHKIYRLITLQPTKIFKPHKERSKDFTREGEPERCSGGVQDSPKGREQRVINQFNHTSFERGERNWALFIASIALGALSYWQITHQEALDRLSVGIRLNLSNDFGMEEIVKTIRSALRYRDGFMFRTQTLLEAGYVV